MIFKKFALIEKTGRQQPLGDSKGNAAKRSALWSPDYGAPKFSGDNNDMQETAFGVPLFAD
jgi:hypothetical protein